MAQALELLLKKKAIVGAEPRKRRAEEEMEMVAGNEVFRNTLRELTMECCKCLGFYFFLFIYLIKIWKNIVYI